MTIILGPVPCKTCRAPVVFGTADKKRNVNRWRDPATGDTHKCKREKQP